MTAKEFFRTVRRAESELKVLNAKLEHYEELGISMGGIAGGTGNRNRSASRVEMAAVGAVDALRDLYDQRREYMAIIARAEHIISQVPQDKYRRILSYHYILGKSLRWISDELDYKDPNSIYRSHGWALYQAQKILNQEEKHDDRAGERRIQGASEGLP